MQKLVVRERQQRKAKECGDVRQTNKEETESEFEIEPEEGKLRYKGVK